MTRLKEDMIEEMRICATQAASKKLCLCRIRRRTDEVQRSAMIALEATGSYEALADVAVKKNIRQGMKLTHIINKYYAELDNLEMQLASWAGDAMIDSPDGRLVALQLTPDELLDRTRPNLDHGLELLKGQLSLTSRLLDLYDRYMGCVEELVELITDMEGVE